MPKVVPEYKDQARARIIEAAGVVFRRKGLRRATMEDIAREVGVSKGAIYLYFRTKADLLVRLQVRTRNLILGKWQGLLEAGEIPEGIAASLDDVFAGDSDPAVWLELIAASATDPEVRRVMALDRKVDLRMMRQFLRRLEDRGRIPKMKDPTTTTEIVVTLLEGTVLRLMMGGSTAETRRTLIAELRLVLGL